MLIRICRLVKGSLQIGQIDTQQVRALDVLDLRAGKHRGRISRITCSYWEPELGSGSTSWFATDATHIESGWSGPQVHAATAWLLSDTLLNVQSPPVSMWLAVAPQQPSPLLWACCASHATAICLLPLSVCLLPLHS
jgi:hypothetical protein